MRAYERLLKYVVVHTASDENSETVPSTMRQFDLAKILVEEMKALGISDARVDEHCYVYGSIPASAGCEKAPKIGLIAHMDTAPDFCGENVHPVLIENYDGKDVVLGSSGRVLSVKQFPHLPELKGRTLITTDGTTLLGADDKSGIAEILTVADELISKNLPHGPIRIAFTPDEEIGRGPDAFDVPGFDADFAYTVDGGEEGGIEYETFNACSAKWQVNGFNVHPGTAKDTMINALSVACEINGLLPAAEVPEHTDGYEGFYHLMHMDGNVESARMSYIIRDHDRSVFEARKRCMRQIEKYINEKYGAGTAVLTMKDSYYNMAEKILPYPFLTEIPKAAAKEAGLNLTILPVRGGTDGSQLSFMGLPCPNLGTGGYAFHGPFEHITAEGMDLSVRMIIDILGRFAKMDRKDCEVKKETMDA